MAWRKQDWSPRRDVLVPKVGQRVVFLDRVDRYPHFVVPAGATGVLIKYDPTDSIRVRLDYLLPGAEEWRNEVHWTVEADDIEAFHTEVAPILT